MVQITQVLDVDCERNRVVKRLRSVVESCNNLDCGSSIFLLLESDPVVYLIGEQLKIN